jgi:hypothetical protein
LLLCCVQLMVGAHMLILHGLAIEAVVVDVCIVCIDHVHVVVCNCVLLACCHSIRHVSFSAQLRVVGKYRGWDRQLCGVVCH